MNAANIILIPVDFSEQSLIAIDQSHNLAKSLNASITLLYVIEDGHGLFKFFSSQQNDEIKKSMESKLKKLASEYEEKYDIIMSTMVARGTVYEKVAEIAEILNANLIIMGTNGSGSIKKRFIGSNALRIVREAKCPVITIKGKHHRDGCKNIVLPLDLTKETRQKVNAAIQMAKYYKATIRVVSVLFTTDEFVVNRLTRQLAQVKGFIEKLDIECTAEIIKGIKGEETLAQNIIDYAHKVDADLVMIMTQQEVDFTEYFIGSAAQEVINSSDIPVLSIVPTLKKDTMEFVKPY